MTTFRSFFHRAYNRQKTTGEIRSEIDRRREIGKPTRQLEDELAARSGTGRSRADLEEEKEEIEAECGDTGTINRAINRTLSDVELASRIADRQRRGLPTRQLEEERASRSDKDD